ncbi:MAG: gamma-glutamyltransferase [Solirubrobacterales bacterium]|nr:gamma-glutamyltransferase [Solirubrobacterales bacterium]
MSSGGVVAAGHPVTAEAGATAMRAGGNAVDGALAAVMTSFVCESPLTGMGAGGHLLVHGFGADTLLDFFVEVPGRDGTKRAAELVDAQVWFTERVPQSFRVGAVSCGVPGVPAGLAEAARRWGSVPLAELAAPAASLAREGVAVNAEQAYFNRILGPILTLEPEGDALYKPGGTTHPAGALFRFPELGDALELLGAEGAAPFYEGEVARRLSDWVLERGGTLGLDDLRAYEPVAREPIRARYRGREVLTNPPPSSGGTLIAFALAVLERLGRSDLETVVRVMAAAQAARTTEFVDGLGRPGFAAGFLDPARIDESARRIGAGGPLLEGDALPADALGSTTHVTAVDVEGRCASVTCSNGSGSGVIVPGTGIHLNNMLGEHDLNPHGFHLLPPGTRIPSMMSPSIVVGDSGLELGLGSGGSNRIRSAILQVILRVIDDGLDLADAVRHPRVHFEQGEIQAEPGVDERALERLEADGAKVERWPAPNVFFGGVHAVARDPDGLARAAGDPRRGGAVAEA